MSSSFISRVISAFAFCTASSLAPEDKTYFKHFLYMKPTEYPLLATFRNIIKLAEYPQLYAEELSSTEQTATARLCSKEDT